MTDSHTHVVSFPMYPSCPAPVNQAREETAIEGTLGHVGHVALPSPAPGLLSGLFANGSPAVASTSTLESRSIADDLDKTPACRHCNTTDFVEDAGSISCQSCNAKQWLLGEDTILHPGFVDYSHEELSPEEIPVCSACQQLCDTQSLIGNWRCSQCDGQATSRFIQTQRWLAFAETIRRRSNRA